MFQVKSQNETNELFFFFTTVLYTISMLSQKRKTVSCKNLTKLFRFHVRPSEKNVSTFPHYVGGWTVGSTRKQR